MVDEGIVFINCRNSVYAGFLEVISEVPKLNGQFLECFESLQKTRNVEEIPYILCISPSKEIRELVLEGWVKRDFREITHD
jgi:hypothetical protein